MSIECYYEKKQLLLRDKKYISVQRISLTKSLFVMENLVVNFTRMNVCNICIYMYTIYKEEFRNFCSHFIMLVIMFIITIDAIQCNLRYNRVTLM